MIEGKRIVITGGNGFLGSHITKLLDKNNTVFALGKSDYNLTEKEDIIKLFKDMKDIDIVIHAAADIGGIGYSSKNPAKQFYNNLLINTYILHYSWLNNVKKFVGIGSVCEYPANTAVPFVESSLWNGYPVDTNDAYGLTKRMLLAQSIAYKRQYYFNSIHLLPVNMYGPKDNFDINNSHVIPALIRKVTYAKENKLPYVEVWGSGKESREFLYVEDAAEAVVLATEKYDDTTPVNIGVGNEIKINEIAEYIKSLLGYNGYFKYLNNGLGGQMRRCLDTTQAKMKFGFSAKTLLKEGLKNTIEYYINNYC